jgi:phosphopantothenoylcysteine decarboxylase/phosphopantothenate--cysteine ligase
MRVIVTAGPTREYLDTVRFITNASSGKMGYACAAAAAKAGHDVTLISGPVNLGAPPGCRLIRITSVEELQAELERHFPVCDGLLMAAAVGDFVVEGRMPHKISRKGGPITIRLVPTPDVLAGLTAKRRNDQVIVGFSVEDRHDEAKARQEMIEKRCDYMVLNPPSAMVADESDACILGAKGLVLPWRHRRKEELAGEVVALLKQARRPTGQ